MTRVSRIVLILAFLTSPAGAAEPPTDVIEGLDPVALTRGEEVQGEEGFAVVRGRFRYLFANAENQRLFEEDPERYEVQVDGLCAQMGGTVLGHPDLWAVHDGRLYLFGTPGCRERFQAAPADFLEPPPAPLPDDPAAFERGAELIERAVAAIGGAAVLDGLSSYREQEERVTTMLVFPGRLHRQREFPGFGVLTEVLTPDDAFFALPDGSVQSYVAAQRASLEQELEHSVVSILRGRRAPTFRAAALGAERVAVRHGGRHFALGIDPESGRVVSLAYAGRGPSGAFGEIVESYSDFREIGGLTLPFRRDVTWNGEPFPQRSATLLSIAVNSDVDAALFVRPALAEETPKPATAAPRVARTVSRREVVEPSRRVARPLEWPQWGGPHRDFTSDATGLAAAWPEGGPPRLWRRELGDGYSAIVAAAGVLYTMFRRGDDDVTVALDAATGATRWESAAAAPFSDEYSMRHGPGPHATPLVAGGRVFAVGATGLLRALDAATGRELWRHDLMAEYGGTLRVNGYASSPLAHDGKVIVMVGGPGHAVMAFDQADGSVAWSGGDFRNSASSPLMIEVDSEEQLVAFLWGEVAGFDPSTGELLWSHPHEPEFGLNVSLPVWSPDDRVLFVSSAYGGGARGLELTRTGAREVWAHTRMNIHFSNAVRVGGRVYASSGEFGPAPFTALELATGRILWRDRRFARAAFIYADGRFILIDENGVLALATPGPDGLAAVSQVELLKPPARTAPALVGTTLYVRDREVVMALDLR